MLFIHVISVLFLLCFHARRFTDALWSAAGKGLACFMSLRAGNILQAV